MMEGRAHRREKIAELLHREVGKIVADEADIPAEIMVTVSSVEVSENHQHAKISVTVFPFERSAEVKTELDRVIREVQYRLNRALPIRPVPQIRFVIDESEEKGHHVLDLIEKADEEGENR
jgi:ribosome-binding factor A